MTVTVIMTGIVIALAMIAPVRQDFYPGAISGIDAAGRFWLQGHVRDAEAGLQHLPRRLQQWRPVVEIIQTYMSRKRDLSGRNVPDVQIVDRADARQCATHASSRE